MDKEKVVIEIELPENTQAALSEGIITLKGPKGTTERALRSKKVNIKAEGKKIILEAKRHTKREKKLLGTFQAHIKNMIKGVTKGHIYRMKICAGHFPMNVSVSNKELLIKNFLGEKVPRKVKLQPGVDIKVEGNELIIESTSKELAGRTASSIEEIAKRPGFDKRVFQDGIFITEKDGKQIK